MIIVSNKTLFGRELYNKSLVFFFGKFFVVSKVFTNDEKHLF